MTVDQRFKFRSNERNLALSAFLSLLFFFFARFLLIRVHQEKTFDASFIATIVVATYETVVFVLARRNEALWLRENELEVTNWLGRVKRRIPYASIESFRNDSYQPRNEYFALISDNGKVRIPGDTPGIAQLSRELRTRRFGADQPYYPQWVDTDPMRPVTPPPMRHYVIIPVVLGIAGLLGLELAREMGKPEFMFPIVLAGIFVVSWSASDAIRRFKVDRQQQFEEIIEW
jgi:hypothetical protein